MIRLARYLNNGKKWYRQCYNCTMLHLSPVSPTPHEWNVFYGMCNNENARCAAEVYCQRHQDKNRFPDHRVFIRLHNAYMEDRKSKCTSLYGWICIYREDAIRDEIEGNSSSRVRQISANVSVPKTTIQRVLKKQYYPFHI